VPKHFGAQAQVGSWQKAVGNIANCLLPTVNFFCGISCFCVLVAFFGVIDKSWCLKSLQK